ncbi:prolipoprotein diacylglyceryl transferase [Microcella putealis]|uniref:Phosphatidylglycerol--prolipoprotein diacylglyceryl transferase n=1 Tax=Microcella putealis TaxID=337005 RepID=A0A4Q7LV68_9MICO|nr:prolipoprotein diacylglyceryl transferase [Microcella putealis]TQM25043.1 prolipoprotein diacylglyceryl transferase [Microcella putealis]
MIPALQPLSIPSPGEEWRAFNLGEWLRELGLTWFSFDILINAYALCILLGIVAAVLLTNARLSRRGAEPWIVLDIALFAVPLGIIGGRIYHVVTHPADYFFPGADLLRVLYIWEGGMAIFGALIGGAIGAYLGCRVTGIRFWAFADALAPGLLLAQAFGRLGNWFNQELFGLPTDLPWGLEIDRPNPAIPVGLPDDILFHPTFLYEIIWNLAGVAVLLLLDARLRVQWGKLLGAYLIWYGVGRSVFETIRLDPSELFLGVRVNVWAAWAAVVLGIVLVLVQRRRHPGVEPGPYQPGREWSPDAGVDSEDVYTETDLTGNDADEVAGKPGSSPATSGTPANA